MTGYRERFRALKGRADEAERASLPVKMALAPMIYADAMALMEDMLDVIEEMDDLFDQIDMTDSPIMFANLVALREHMHERNDRGET